MIEEVDNIIEHFGVKGMKWGIRKDRRPSSSKSSKDYKKGEEKRLSDQELRARVNRLNMERQYRDLISKQNPPSSMRRGVKAVGGILAGAGSKAIRDYLGKRVFKAVVEDLGKKLQLPGSTR